MRRSLGISIVAASWGVFLAVSPGYPFVRSGPAPSPDRPARPRSGDAFLQRSLSEGPAWKAFEGRYDRRWTVEWNEEDATPHRAYGVGIPLGPVSQGNVEAVSRRFIDENPDLFKIPSEDLTLISAIERGRLWYVTFQREYQGIPVDGALTTLRFTEDGRLILFGADTHPLIDIPAQPALRAEEAERVAREYVGFLPEEDRVVGMEFRIFPRDDDRRQRYLLAYRVTLETAVPLARSAVLVDARTGRVADAWDALRRDTVLGTVTGEVQLDLPQDPFVERPFKSLRVEVPGQGFDHTDETGSYSIEVSDQGPLYWWDVTAQLRGEFVLVLNEDGSEAFFAGTATAGVPFNFMWDNANSHPAERDVYYHAIQIHDYVKGIDPSFTGMDYPVVAHVNYPLNQVLLAGGVDSSAGR